MKRIYKVLFVAVLGLILIAAAVDVKNSGMSVTNSRLNNPVGTAALPGVTFNGDPNTGLSAAVADTPVISAGGSAIATFSSTGMDLGALDLTCNQATITVDAITALTAPSVTTAVASDGILLRNTTAAATAQEFSPSLRLDGTGYTAGPTNTRHSWVVTNKPTSATTGKITFDFAIAGETPVEKASIGYDGYIAGTYCGMSSYFLGYGGILGAYQQTIFGTVNAYGFVTLGNYVLNLSSAVTDSSSAVSIKIGNNISFSTEGARSIAGYNATANTWNVDKNGVFNQGYASGQVTDAVPSLDLTLVTAMDDDSIYDLVVGCEYIGYAAGVPDTPNFYFASNIGATFARVDTVSAEVGTNTTITHKESAAGCVPCAVATTNAGGAGADIIKVTFTQCDLAADVANVKTWISSMRKTNITTFTGVNQPAAN